jgi:hypothetical protein
METGLSMKLGGAFGFLAALPPDSWRYAGQGVKLNAPDTPIFWVKSRTGDAYQALYADLSVKEVAEGELPTAPKAKAD